VDPSLAAAVSMIAAALATAILRFAAYQWPSGYHRRGSVKDNAEEKIERKRRARRKIDADESYDEEQIVGDE
jgi:hypothetical protein